MEIPDWQCTATHCSFCGKHAEAIEFLVVGPNAIGICNECIFVASNVVKEHRDKKKCCQK